VPPVERHALHQLEEQEGAEEFLISRHFQIVQASASHGDTTSHNVVAGMNTFQPSA